MPPRRPSCAVRYSTDNARSRARPNALSESTFTVIAPNVLEADRFATAAFALALAGSLSTQRRRSVGEGSLPGASPLFGGVLFFTVLIVSGLSFLPALVLGPVAEQLSVRPAETTSGVVR